MSLIFLCGIFCKSDKKKIVKFFYQDVDKTSPNFVVTKENIMGTTRYDKDYNYNKDIQGSTTSEVGQDGTSLVTYDYDDFGVTRSIGDSTFFNEICYTGAIYDVSTGLYYLNAKSITRTKKSKSFASTKVDDDRFFYGYTIMRLQ